MLPPMLRVWFDGNAPWGVFWGTIVVVLLFGAIVFVMVT